MPNFTNTGLCCDNFTPDNIGEKYLEHIVFFTCTPNLGLYEYH